MALMSRLPPSPDGGETLPSINNAQATANMHITLILTFHERGHFPWQSCIVGIG